MEIHLTLPASLERETLCALAHRHGLATTFVVLSRGSRPVQPMLTTRVVGDLRDALARADALRRALARDGVDVLRVKVERDLRRSGPDPRARYLEHHVKVRVASTSIEALGALAREHTAHLSRNALARPDEGHELRFLTQRFAPHARAHADRALQSLLEALDAAREEVVGVEREHVLYDSNMALDTGWDAGVEAMR